MESFLVRFYPRLPCKGLELTYQHPTGLVAKLEVDERDHPEFVVLARRAQLLLEDGPEEHSRRVYGGIRRLIDDVVSMDEETFKDDPEYVAPDTSEICRRVLGNNLAFFILNRDVTMRSQSDPEDVFALFLHVHARVEAPSELELLEECEALGIQDPDRLSDEQLLEMFEDRARVKLGADVTAREVFYGDLPRVIREMGRAGWCLSGIVYRESDAEGMLPFLKDGWEMEEDSPGRFVRSMKQLSATASCPDWPGEGDLVQMPGGRMRILSGRKRRW